LYDLMGDWAGKIKKVLLREGADGVAEEMGC
jgi:hypothetical protein